MGGWCGRLLRVDLTRGSVRVEGLEEKVLRRFLGGRGLATYLLWREVPGRADPLGPENVLVFAPGVLTGVPAPGCGRNGVAALSPLTGRLGSAEAGGFWGAELKRAGFDALVVEGRSPYPVYLWVHEGGAEIRDARHLRGLPTGEVESRLREELGDRIRVCDDLAAVCKANEICAAQGLDSISTGVTVAFAMEGAERGVWEGWPDARVPRFGDAAGMVELVGRIAAREGIGDLLAEGALRAARFLGRGSEAWAVQVKGQEVPMHEPRLKHALGLGYAVSPTGADHCHNLHDTAWVKDGSSSVRDAGVLGLTGPLPLHDLGPDKVRLFTYVTNWRHFQDSAVVCYFVPWTYHQLVELVRAVTGWNTSLFELLKVGERVATLARLFNIKQGWTKTSCTPGSTSPSLRARCRGSACPGRSCCAHGASITA
ncbi:MAG: hypothetical protein H5U04_03975 [Firmicutes bacterium]|nr:hypothetical protein [Bacillota bacterium]